MPPNADALSIESLRRIEQWCSEYESLPQPQRIQQFLQLASDRERPALARELVGLDAELRASRGETPHAEDYRSLCAQPGIAIDHSELRDLVRGQVQVAEPKPLSTRYRFIQRIGRGGNGDVWKVEDWVGQRTLALKLLRGPLENSSAATLRMNREALLTGRLQHPGIPPIYDHGVLEDGRPFFTMKLVGGETFADILKNRSDSSDELTRCLGIFEQLAQTVAYAHAQGVIHRDLKPQNVMVGAFGEVQVMDWGMAKPSAESTLETSTTQHDSDRQHSSLQSAQSDDDTTPRVNDESWDDLQQSLTANGDVLGTPAYMSPEQARGEIKTLDARSDVFALGAILFEILTRRRLHHGCSVIESLQRTTLGQFDSALATLHNSDAHPELKTLCENCLSTAPELRPADAGIVSNAITDHLTGVEKRARLAEIQQREASVRSSEDRKRRQLQTRTALVVAVISIIGAGVAIWQRREAVRAGQETSDALALADQRFDEAQSVVDEFLTRVADDNGVLTRTAGAQAIRRDLMQKAVDYYEDLEAGSKQTPEFRFKIAQTHRRLGEVMYLLSPGGEKLEHHADQAIRICEQLLADDPGNPTYLACKTDAYALKVRALSQSWRDQQALPIARSSRELARTLMDIRGNDDDHFRYATHTGLLALIYHRLKDRDPCQTLFQKAIQIATPIQQANPDNGGYATKLARIQSNYGAYCGWGRGQWKDCRKHFQMAVDLQEQAVQLQPSRVDWCHGLATFQMNLAMSLTHTGDIPQAESMFRDSIRSHEKVVRENPLDVDSRWSLALIYGNFATFSLTRLKNADDCEQFLILSAEQYKRLTDEHPDVEVYMESYTDALESLIDVRIRIANAQSSLDVPNDPTMVLRIARPELQRMLKQWSLWLDAHPDSQKYRRSIAYWSALLPETSPDLLLKSTDHITGDRASLRQLDSEWINARALALIRCDRHTEAIDLLKMCESQTPSAVRLTIEALARVDQDPDAAVDYLRRAKAYKFKVGHTRSDYRMLAEQADAVIAEDQRAE
ncbi:protein kinase domain-containing protein [Crateriforma conspicua]|uniref:protein kinase domain-containing protein n=1 Tax=Crateriforma conspicua TaxID=2527996 RepID=UPI001187BCE0|nr:protein kinase [Crateriforma conspicua]QDV63798.1 Serine/threonine-protein kinase PknD [Crateriforma conspicua]